MKYFKKGDEVFAFEDDSSQDFLITEEMTPLVGEELERHLNPMNFITEEERQRLYVKSLRPLTRRQFMRALVLRGYDLDLIEQQINQIEDNVTRQLALIDWKEATEFQRLDNNLIMMATMLGLNSDQIDEMWEYGLNI